MCATLFADVSDVTGRAMQCKNGGGGAYFWSNWKDPPKLAGIPFTFS